MSIRESFTGPNAEIRDNPEIAGLAAIVNSTDDAIIGKNLNGIVESWNHGAEILYGYSRSEMIGRSMAVLLPPDRAGEETEIVRSLQSGKHIQHFETIQIRKDGTRVNVSLTISPILNRDAKVIGASYVARDVTERVRYEQALAQLAAIVDSSDDAIVGKSVDGIIQTWNTGAERLYGYSAEEVIGRSMVSLLQKNRIDEEAEILSRIRRGESVHHFETVRVRKDGKPLTVSLTVSPIRNSKGEIVAASHIARDISERTQLERAKAQLAAIIESSEDAIISENLAGHILTWNAAAERVYGYSRSDALWNPVSMLTPPDRVEEEATIRTRLKSGERIEPFETIRVRKDGRHIHVSLTVSPIRNTAGEIIGVSQISRDVTEARQMRDRLQLAQKMEAVGRLAGGVAHDFNNLLTVITGYGALLRSKLKVDPANSSMLEEIMTAAERATELTRQLLAFSRRQPVQLGSLDLNDAIAKMQTMLRRLIGEDITIQTGLASNVWKIWADPGQIGQIIMNLAVNARDAMPEGGKIVIQTENCIIEKRSDLPEIDLKPGSYVRLMFSDTGHGMDAATRARIFEPFFTTKEVGKGTGLGLSTVYGIVKQSGGHISVYSEPGLGTTFAIYFPRAEKDQADAPSLETKQTAKGHETILLVEDEPSLRKLAASVLSSNGYNVLEAGNAEEAVTRAQAETGTIQLLLTDLVMPGTNGRKLATALAAQRPDLRLIFMSGYSEHTILQDIPCNPRTAFLQKPFTPAQLLQKVREVLDA